MIKQGEKIFEIRLNDEKRKLIKVGDKIKFFMFENLDKSFVCSVTDLLYFKNFDEMINSLSPTSIGMKGLSAFQIKNIYREFYTLEDEQKYGVIAIKLNIV